MRILICGVDGYIGWPLALHLLDQGHEVCGIDNFNRRRWVKQVGSISATDISDMQTRVLIASRAYDGLRFMECDLCDYDAIDTVLKTWVPDAIVHLAEMPSAPYSMLGHRECVETHNNNVCGTINLLYAMQAHCADAHLVKLGTMGEYGQPNVDIPEGTFTLEFRGRQDEMLFPRRAGSWYHLTKVHDTHNIEFACRALGIRSTDIMQGVVYGTRTTETLFDRVGPVDNGLMTRVDFDECFGTAINRFCASAVIGEPLTVYSSGRQTRGFLPLRDSIQCLTIAINNPPEAGEYRTWNQYHDCYSILELAMKVAAVYTTEFACKTATIQHFDNPRVELDDHYYNPDCQKLFDLGYVPSDDIDRELWTMLDDLCRVRHRINAYRHKIKPCIKWADIDDRAEMDVTETVYIGGDKK